MTLILATKDCIAADRRGLIEDSVTTMCKLHISPCKTFAAAFSGRMPDFSVLGVERAFKTMAAISILHGRRCEIFRDASMANVILRSAMTEAIHAAIGAIDYHTRAVGIVITPFHTIHLPHYEGPDESRKPFFDCFTSPEEIHTDGSGERTGRIFLNEGISIPDTFKYVSAVDNMVSPDHDIFYRKDLARIVKLDTLFDPTSTITEVRLGNKKWSEHIENLAWVSGAMVCMSLLNKSFYAKYSKEEKARITKSGECLAGLYHEHHDKGADYIIEKFHLALEKI